MFHFSRPSATVDGQPVGPAAVGSFDRARRSFLILIRDNDDDDDEDDGDDVDADGNICKIPASDLSLHRSVWRALDAFLEVTFRFWR